MLHAASSSRVEQFLCNMCGVNDIHISVTDNIFVFSQLGQAV